MKLSAVFAGVLLALTSAAAWAGASDLQFPPTTSAGHDFNHAPIGQSFQALAANVKAGIFLADEESFTSWLATIYPGQIQPGSYPYAVAPSVTVTVQLLEGEGVDGIELHSRTFTLAKPFMGFVEVDYAAAGVSLVPGNRYTLLMTDVSGQAYPNGVTGWVVPSVTDSSSSAPLPPGAYADGQPILQGALVIDDAGIGDNAFEVLDVGGSTPPSPPMISGTLPYGQVGQPYTGTLSASGGVPPYTWDASGLPAGLALGDDGTISGTPTAGGTFDLVVTVMDSDGRTAQAAFAMVVSELSCSKPKGTKASKGKGTVSQVGASYIIVGAKRIDYASCTSMNYGGYATAPAKGDRVEWQGFVEPNGNVMAQTLTFN